MKQTPAGIKSSARSLSNPFHSLIAGAIDRVRSLCLELRKELATGLTGLGTVSARLAEVDLLITGLSAREVGRLFDRLPAALEQEFTEGLTAAVRALPQDAQIATLGPWYADAGWVSAHRERCRGFVFAALEHERHSLTGLLQAVSDLPESRLSGGPPVA